MACVSTAYADTSAGKRIDLVAMDLKLKEIAIEHKLIPKDAVYNDEFYNNAESKGETIITWILMPIDAKIKTIDSILKRCLGKVVPQSKLVQFNM